MIHGLDTGFLLAAELAEHAHHVAARGALAKLSAAGDVIAIAPQVLAEFIHVAMDSRPLALPLDMTTANQVALQWWTAIEVIHIFPDDAFWRDVLEGRTALS
jgi:predicted nucleic acid-binding protein